MKRIRKLRLLESPDFLCILALISICVVIVFWKVKIIINGPVPWDTFSFLSTASYLAGNGSAYTDFLRPPLLPLLTFIIFKMGITSEIGICILDGFFFIFGVIGLYLLFRQRFNTFESFLGSLIYISFPIILLWVSAGYNDIISTSFSIWVIYFAVLAAHRNPKFVYLSFLFLTLAFLTRLNMAIIIFPLILFILMSDLWKNYKEITFGVLFSLLLMIPFLIFLDQTLGNPFSLFYQFFGTSMNTVNSTVLGYAPEHFAYNLQSSYYLINFPYSVINMDLFNNSNLIILLSILIAEIIVLYGFIMGMIVYLRKKLKYVEFDVDSKTIFGLRNILLTIILFISFLLSLILNSYILSLILFTIFMYMLYRVVKNENKDDFRFDLLFLSWLGSFLIFSSLYDIKVFRYFIPIMPAFAYFLILGLSQFSTKIKFKAMNFHVKNIFWSFLVILFLMTTFSFIYTLENDPVANGSNFKIISADQGFKFEITGKPYSGELYAETYNTQELKIVTNWLKEYDPNYKNKIIYSDYFWPHLSWYLKTRVNGLSSIKKENLSSDLKKRNVDYYISMVSNVELEDFVKISEFKTKFANVSIYRKK